MTQRRTTLDSASTSLTATILRLPFALRGKPDLSYPGIASVQAHWETLRNGRTAPARSELDPRPLSETLDVLFIAELVAPGVARMRLCGQHFTELLGMEPRGMPLSVLFSVTARETLASALAQVAQGARVTLPLRAEKGLGRPGLDGMLALMPLTDHNGTITRVLGVLETHGQIGRAPRRFNLTAPVQTKPVTQAQDPLVPARRGVPALTVIKGGRS